MPYLLRRQLFESMHQLDMIGQPLKALGRLTALRTRIQVTRLDILRYMLPVMLLVVFHCHFHFTYEALDLTVFDQNRCAFGAGAHVVFRSLVVYQGAFV